MAMKKSDNKIKLVAACAVALFSVITCVTGTIAWFTASRISNNDNDSLQVVAPSGIFKKVTFHELIQSERSNDSPVGSTYYNYKFNQIPIGTISLIPGTSTDLSESYNYASSVHDGATNITLGEYNVLDQRHPLLLLFELDEEHTATVLEPITLNGILDDDTYYMGETTISNNKIVPVNELYENGNPLSSVVRFTSYGLTSTQLDNLEGTGTYLGNSYDTYNFANANNRTYNSFVDMSDVENPVLNDSQMIYRASVGDTLQYIAVIFDYYDESIEYIYSIFMGDELTQEYLNYRCDFKMVM